MPTTEPHYEELPCQLTAQELLLKSKHLAEQLSEQASIESEKKLANEGFRARLAALERGIEVLANEVRTGREYRTVTCFERANYAESRVEIIRSDTGEVVRMRALDPHERQAELPLARATETDDDFKREML